MTIDDQYTSCMRCGSPDVRERTLGDGLVPGLTESQGVVCRGCGHQGQPMIFDSADEQVKFQKEKTEGDAQ